MNMDRQPIEHWIEQARKAGIIGSAGFDTDAAAEGKATDLLYPRSLKQRNGAVFALLKMPGISHDQPAFAWDRVLGIFGLSAVFAGFEGEVEALDGNESALKEDIIRFARENCAPYEVPKVIEIIGEMPLTAVGKIDKKVLRAQET